MDLTDLYNTYSQPGKIKTPPRIMTKIILYAYMEGLYSSRGIESACRRDINYRFLLEGHKVPDHSTVARFRTLHFGPCAVKMMAEMTNLLKGIGEISGKTVFVDGTKIEANANKYTFVWKKATTKYQKKLCEKIAGLVEDCVNRYGFKSVWHGEVKKKNLEQLIRRLENIQEEEKIEFVYGKGTRKTQLQRDLEDAQEYLEKYEEYEKKLKICGDRNSYSKTDQDATFMHMKEDHMRNGQLKPGYNLQVGADAGYAVWADLYQSPGDVGTLIPFLKSAEQNLGFKYETVVADAGYESEENYSWLEEHDIRGMIKPANYEISKTRKYKHDISRRENMDYDEEQDCYTCSAGKKLVHLEEKKQKTKSGYIRETTIYECEDCTECPYKQKCIKGNHSKTPLEERIKRLQVSRKFERQRKDSLERITTDEGCMLRMNRSIQAEGVFAEVKEDRGFKRYQCRGYENVLTETILIMMAQNLCRLDRKVQTGRTALHLYPLKEAA
jgi:transposase/CRISPR/Cas system-associated endoribonuclease Cas2